MAKFCKTNILSLRFVFSSIKPQFSTCTGVCYPKIYTKTGDKGKSSTFTGERRSKDDDIFEALGSTDELTSHIGFARQFLPPSCDVINKQLEEVQCIIQDLAAAVATPKSSSKEVHEKASVCLSRRSLPPVRITSLELLLSPRHVWRSACRRESLLGRTRFPPEHVETLEIWIDEHTKKLPPLNNFILPAGGQGSAALHVARSVCRRAERRVVPLVKAQEVDEAPMRYLNRLSDYLFTVARVVGLASGQEEFIYWQPRPKPNKAD